MFVWPSVNRLFAKAGGEPIIHQFTNHLITTEFWATFPPVWVAIPFLFVCGFMTVYFLGSKGFCTYGCPYGGFFSLADKVAPGKIRVTDACNQCGHCTATCTSNVLVHAEVKQYGMVVDPGCMKCMDCISVCPNDALYFGFGKPSIAIGRNPSGSAGVAIAEFGSRNAESSSKSKTQNRRYDLTWPEEALGAVVFFLSFLAVWDVYQLVPMLMALGIAAITTFLALRTLRLLRAADLSFYRFNLKSSGAIKKAGWAFLGFALLWIGLNAHSGWVRYHENGGVVAFQGLQIPDELALARSNPDQWLSPSDRVNIAEGEKHFKGAVNFGLFTNSEALPKLAWFEYLSGNTQASIDLLGRAAEHQQGQAKALSLYYRGSILNRLGRYDEALTSLDQALAERPDLVLALEEKGESLWQLGRKEQAIAVWSDAVRSNAGLPLANNFLAGAAASIGRSADAAAYEKQAEPATPNDPYYHWMLGLRLQNLGMNELAEKHFGRATQLNPAFHLRRSFDPKQRR
jgi:tetratricopeptide (TPR) repeat protein/NAD-dependent dihydropyrimidine dehydrogenase PreA subunit